MIPLHQQYEGGAEMLKWLIGETLLTAEGQTRKLEVLRRDFGRFLKIVDHLRIESEWLRNEDF